MEPKLVCSAWTLSGTSMKPLSKDLAKKGELVCDTGFDGEAVIGSETADIFLNILVMFERF